MELHIWFHTFITKKTKDKRSYSTGIPPPSLNPSQRSIFRNTGPFNNFTATPLYGCIPEHLELIRSTTIFCKLYCDLHLFCILPHYMSVCNSFHCRTWTTVYPFVRGIDLDFFLSHKWSNWCQQAETEQSRSLTGEWQHPLLIHIHTNDRSLYIKQELHSRSQKAHSTCIFSHIHAHTHTLAQRGTLWNMR